MPLSHTKREELKKKFLEALDGQYLLTNKETFQLADYWLKVLDDELQAMKKEIVERIEDKNRIEPLEHGYRYYKAMQDAIEIIHNQ